MGPSIPDTAPLPLDPRAVRPAASARDRDDAIRQCGEVLLAVGAVESAYIGTMLERERSVSTYVGEGVAIPHGTLAAKDTVRHDAVCVVRFPGGVDWDGEEVTVCIGIAARGDGHVRLLAELAEILLDPDRARALREATEVAEVIRLLQPIEEGEELR
ncbi:PTS system mannitol-specific IIA component [Streptosporangium album]|uniref:Mannitol-specific phosphotransferase enzyme IIA component n=1 Tax=Streptosporangium album TaxID=47479 RepID=A0A7W7S3J5_9ACTN|nr:PTS sugar transporter subunit IIA [Streptosporangium album]MBB4943205.1 PTS system mannitol-specific IIA component [Streptosporangium album]